MWLNRKLFIFLLFFKNYPESLFGKVQLCFTARFGKLYLNSMHSAFKNSIICLLLSEEFLNLLLPFKICFKERINKVNFVG